MIIKRIAYFLLFAFFIWLALATRWYPRYFPALVQTYGGDVFWAGAFLFLLRAFFMRARLWVLAVITYVLGVLDEFSQLYQGPVAQAVRHTYIGRLMFGVGFLWSDILCYAIGVLLAYIILIIAEKEWPGKQRFSSI